MNGKEEYIMDLMDVSLPVGNKLVSKYILRDEEVQTFFDYQDIENDKTYSIRANDLSNRSYPREELTSYLMEFHSKFNVNSKTFENIKRFQDPRSVVVIGGQQAGLLTGPLFTIHKIISIIKLARKQERNLKIPVLPVFWIAGEDHDFDEINHVYINKAGNATKTKINQRQYKKCTISALDIDKELAQKWIEDVVESFGETDETTSLMESLQADLTRSKTYVDFFIRLVYRLFPNEGLIVVDSGDAGFRKIGSSFMKSIIMNNDILREKVIMKQMLLKESGFGEPIEINEHNAHLFYMKDGERVLLEKYNDRYIGKSHDCQFSQSELETIAINSPALLSNNVVTRPLMQEFIFPTLAFISGPGEIAYWAVLKEAFHLFGFKMPIIVPRLMISIIDRATAKYIQEHELDLKEVLLSGSRTDKERWFNSQKPNKLDRITDETISKVADAHNALKELAIEIDGGLKPLAEKNAQIIQSQILFLRQRVEKALYNKHTVELRKFEHIDLSLRPLNAPQERIWNIFYFINLYGFEFVDDLLKLDFAFNSQHKVIFL
ncbi:bacillithiol biosynthesis cysteine-adding enzyme BshC [Bacillus sp. Marseille-P3661]|uniref:bacillithiol biosynthesis cysteine-adding enzyme BshC n=1 Tax=Bacillus sp. Marseille-P3661 TaxID=1936234 RepID=UPI0021557035|nr:bacillithiol biosynthesis cysteine-adding enzyme BshC [Bacillus sp. Marseille-P3661]